MPSRGPRRSKTYSQDASDRMRKEPNEGARHVTLETLSTIVVA
jgi:hypothetical protein